MASRTGNLIRVAAGAAALTAGPPLSVPRAEPLECFSTAETRQKIVSQKLADPFATMQSVGGGRRGEPIAAKLCRRGDDFVYEISLLRRDGRLVKVYVDAVSGRPHAEPSER